MRPLLPALGVAGLLGALALVLDHGLAAGLGRGAFDAAGRLYFALLLGAPLLLYPLARRSGLRARARVALALLPAFLWWLSEIRMRMRWHPLPEALWLAASPVNLAHLYLVLLATALVDAGARLAAWLRGRRGVLPRRRAALAFAAALLLGPALVLGSIPGFLSGHRALFQDGLLPMPAALPGPLPPASVPRAARVPNVVFILSDDHRADFAGHAGHPFVETPSLDRLAAEGVRFERAYVTSSLCSPSRASFLTGTYPHRHGVWNNFTPWSDGNRTFFEYLSQAGYATAFIGKWHMPGRLPALRGVGPDRRERGRGADAARARGRRSTRAHAGPEPAPPARGPARRAPRRAPLPLLLRATLPDADDPRARDAAPQVRRVRRAPARAVRPRGRPARTREPRGSAAAPLEAALAARLDALAAELER